jgi:hypothetical protein
MKFIYSSGQRVLDGYTIKRGIGRGGFGEVYYALSDGGKEVALKLVRGANLEMELRGMAQCLNLKHPNLLALYDLRTDNHGDRWVVMEYISGEPLAEVLNRHPQGLPDDLARQWFLEMAHGVAYLHDHGIVHRDLKPANIFLEGGTVKVGDYGLSKFISSSQHTAQTQSVGTVHYMAPEISTGNYNKQIDIYASGIILYEMLTGRVPFDGESTGEILMKHLTTAPDLSKLPADYVPIVGKALAKNPAHRFPTMGEMARAVDALGAAAEVVPLAQEPIRRGSPVRERPPVAQAVAEPQTPAPAPTMPGRPAVSFRGQVAELCGSLTLAVLFALVAFTIWTAVASVDDRVNVVNLGTGFFLTVAICWAVLLPAKLWNGHPGDSGLRRTVLLAFGALVGLGAYWLDWGTFPWVTLDPEQSAVLPQTMTFFGHRSGIPLIAGYISYFGLALFALRWWKLADRHRSHRFSFAPILAAGFWAFILLLVWPWSEVSHGPLPLLLASGIIQLVSPWEQPPPPAAKRVRLRYA